MQFCCAATAKWETNRSETEIERNARYDEQIYDVTRGLAAEHGQNVGKMRVALQTLGVHEIPLLNAVGIERGAHLHARERGMQLRGQPRRSASEVSPN